MKFASLVDFIPLPSQWEMHAQFADRYGTIDVFYFDFYSIALSKIERGNNRDIADVKLLVQSFHIYALASSVSQAVGTGILPQSRHSQNADGRPNTQDSECPAPAGNRLHNWNEID